MPSTLQPTNLEPSSSKDANLSPSSLSATDCEPSDSEAETTVSIDEKVYLEEKKKYLHIFRIQEKDGSRNHVYCKLCVKYPEIVRRFCESNRTPTITTTIGIRYKKNMCGHIYHQNITNSVRLQKKQRQTQLQI